MDEGLDNWDEKMGWVGLDGVVRCHTHSARLFRPVVLEGLLALLSGPSRNPPPPPTRSTIFAPLPAVLGVTSPSRPSLPSFTIEGVGNGTATGVSSGVAGKSVSINCSLVDTAGEMVDAWPSFQ